MSTGSFSVQTVQWLFVLVVFYCTGSSWCGTGIVHIVTIHWRHMRSCVCVHMHIHTVHPLHTPHRCIQFGGNIQERWVWFWAWSFWSGVWGTHRQLRSKEKEKRQIWRQWKSGPSILLRSALPSQKVVLLPTSPLCKWCKRATRHRQHLTKPCETITRPHFSCRNDSSKMFWQLQPFQSYLWTQLS